jgi:hypothetical protein
MVVMMGNSYMFQPKGDQTAEQALISARASSKTSLPSLTIVSHPHRTAEGEIHPDSRQIWHARCERDHTGKGLIQWL